MNVFKIAVAGMLMVVAFATHSADLKGVGLFETLDKPWFVTALYVEDHYDQNHDDQGSTPEQSLPTAQQRPIRLEFKVVEDRISQRRFRQLWQGVMAVVQDQSLLLNPDFERFLSVIKGPLKQHDHIVLKREQDHVALHINYHQHARLSEDFLTDLVQVLTARIAPIPELKHGLMGKLSRAELRDIQQTFDRGEPSLHRISQTSRWLRQRNRDLSHARVASAEPSA